MQAYVDGRFLAWNEASVSIRDPGFQFGLGIFTTARVEEGRVLHWPSHLRRLEEGMNLLAIPRIEISYAKVNELLEINGCIEGVWKLKVIVTAGSGAGPLLAMLIEPYTAPRPDFWDLRTYPVDRHPLLAKCKTLSYLENLLLLEEAKRAGADDMLMTTREGILLETTSSAIFWLVDRCIFHPSFDLPLLKSTSLCAILESYRGEGWSSQGVKMRFDDVPKEAVWFACNAMKGPFPIRRINDKPLLMGSVQNSDYIPK